MITGRNTVWLIPLLIILTFPLWKFPVSSFLEPRGGFDPQFTKKKSDKHNFTMMGVTILQTKGNQRTASISATKARTGNKPNEYILEDVNADIVDDKGTLTNVIAKTGNYNIDKEKLKLIDDVIVTNITEKFTMTTNLLYYDGKKMTVYSPVATKLTGDGIVIRGTSLDYDMNKAIYTVGGKVYCTLHGFEGS